MAPMLLAPCAPAIGLRQQVAMPVSLAHAGSAAVRRPVVAPASPEGLPTRRVLKPLASAAVEAPTKEADTPDQGEQTEEKNLPCNAFYRDAILLQGFGWDSSKKEAWYGTIASKVADIKKMGFTHVWLPPPSQSVSAEGYLPGQLYNLDSKYGNKEQLQALIKALHDAGLKAMADIVINHRCADDKQDGVYNKFRDDVDHNGKSIDWGRWAITGDDPHFKGKGNPDTGADYEAAPDLDHANPELREALKDWLKWLQNDIGFDGWRFDYVKGFGAEFIKEYVDSTVGADSFNVGEFWTDLHWEGSDLGWNQDAARQVLADWIDKNGQTCTAFDFPTKGILQEAVKNTQYNRLKDRRNKPPGFLGYWPGMTVTFVDNHDTGSTQQHWPFPGDFTALGYAYILTHPGIPSVFWDHVFAAPDDVRDAIGKMMALRRKHDIHADSKLEILAAEHDMYVARIDNKIAVKLGPRYDMGDKVPSEKDGWKFALSGKDFAIWERE